MGNVQGSDAVFPPTLPDPSETRGGYKAQYMCNNCLYNHAEKLPTAADKESPSPKYYYKHCSKTAQVFTATMGRSRLTAQSRST